MNSVKRMTMAMRSKLSQRQMPIYCAAIIVLLVAFPIILWSSLNQSVPFRMKKSSNPLFESIMTARDTCQITKVFPFRVGCPKECQRQLYTDEPMYRMSVAWYLGMPDMEEGTAYERGINYQCPIEFVNNFRRASKQLGSIQATRDVLIKYQPRMHLSLNYLCCLRKNETDWVREIMYKWILDNYPYKFSVKFDKFQCWHERMNSVTTIIIADEQSQQVLLKISNDIEEKLLEKGIPTEIHRTDQMPFHVTLLGVYRGTDENDPVNNISSDIPYIYEIVNNVSLRMGSKWAGDGRMLIQHAPKMNLDGVVHAGKVPTGP